MSGQPQGRSARYEILLDPTDRFIVWDESADHPALLEGEIISCDTFLDAQRAVKRLSSIRSNAAEAGDPDLFTVKSIELSSDFT